MPVNPADYIASPLAYPDDDENWDRAQEYIWDPEQGGYVLGTPGGELGPLRGGTPGGELGPLHGGTPGLQYGSMRGVPNAPPDAMDPLEYALGIGDTIGSGLDALGPYAPHRMVGDSAKAGMESMASMSDDEKRRVGILGQMREGFRGSLDNVLGKLAPPAEAAASAVRTAGTTVFGEGEPRRDQMPQLAPPPAATADADPEVVDPQAGGSRLGYRNGVFTNIGVTDEDAAAYRGGVSDFREKMRDHQEALGPPPPDQILSQSGRTRPGGHMLGNPDAPLPGDADYPEGGFVSISNFADPTQELTDEGWRAMTPGAKDEFLRQSAEVSGVRQAQSAGTLAQHEAKMAIDPEYAAANRTGLFQSFVNKAKASVEVQEAITTTMAEYKKARPDVPENSPAWLAAMEQIRKKAISAWLTREHGDFAQWDDVLSKNTGLTFS